MPPYQGGGEMILSVEYQKTKLKKAPHRFEAGTPDISGPIGLHAAMDYLDEIGRAKYLRNTTRNWRLRLRKTGRAQRASGCSARTSGAPGW